MALIKISKQDVNKAIQKTDWDFGNQILYDLCYDYLSRHGAVLGEEIEEKISECIGVASWNKFEISKEQEVTLKGKEEGEKIYKLLNEAKKLMIDKVVLQART